MKAILSFLNFIVLWFVSFWTFYGTFELEIEWLWLAILGSCSIYASLFSISIKRRKSALDSISEMFANFIKHGLCWCFIYLAFICALIYAARYSPGFDPNDKESQIGMLATLLVLVAGPIVLYLPVVIVGLVGWVVSKGFQVKRNSSNKSFKLTALRAAA